MEIITIPADLKLFYVEADSFPEGIKPAYEKLEKLVPAWGNRHCYGIYTETPQGIRYQAAATESFEGEGASLGCPYVIIEKGNYLSETITGWMSKTETIGPTFEQLLKDERADKNSPGIEFYKSTTEMACLVKVKETLS